MHDANNLSVIMTFELVRAKKIEIIGERMIFLCKVLASQGGAASEERCAMQSNETEQQIL